jgi:uncharacterized protein
VNRLIALLSASLLVAVSHASHAQTPPLSVAVEPARIGAEVRSFKSLRDAGVIKQQYDYSCGAASFATLLTYGLDDPISENEVLARVIARLSQSQEADLKAKGLSLLDLKALAEERGHRANGFRLTLDQLVKLTRPVIVFIRPFGYEHFAVLRGIRDGKVFLADPSLGQWRMPLWRFAPMWTDDNGRGVIFVAERSDGRWLDTGALALGAPALNNPELMAIQSRIDPARAAGFSPTPRVLP